MSGAGPPPSPPRLVLRPPAPTPTCDWIERIFRGRKYYYNVVSGEEKWEKPKELIEFEQQQNGPPPPGGPSNDQQQSMKGAFNRHRRRRIPR